MKLVELIKITTLQEDGSTTETYKYDLETYKFYKHIKYRPGRMYSTYQDRDMLMEISEKSAIDTMEKYVSSIGIESKLLQLKREIKLKDVI